MKGLLDGKVEVNYSDGSKFIGFYVLGQKSKGNLIVKHPKTMHNLKTYDGEWSHGRMHGKGVITNKDGSLIKSSFHNGNLHGESTFISSNTTEVSKFVYGVRDGKYTLSVDGHITLNGTMISNTVILPNGLQSPIAPTVPHFATITGLEQSKGTMHYE